MKKLNYNQVAKARFQRLRKLSISNPALLRNETLEIEHLLIALQGVPSPRKEQLFVEGVLRLSKLSPLAA